MQPAAYGNLLSQRRDDNSHFFHFDGLGSTDRLTDAAEAITDSYCYAAYGKLLGSSGNTVNPFLWIGRVGYFEDAELEQYYVRARHYEPTLARWLSVDPIGFAAGDRNLYRYVGNTPITVVDPSGLACPGGFSKRTAKMAADWTNRVVSTYVRSGLQSSYSLPRTGTWSPETGVEITRTCSFKKVCVKQMARISRGNRLVSTTIVGTGNWTYDALTVATWGHYSTGGSLPGLARFERAIIKNYQAIEDWDVVWEYKCKTIKRVLMAGEWQTYCGKSTGYDYKNTGRLVLFGVTVPVPGTQRELGTTWINPQTGYVSARDPRGWLHEDVEYFPMR